MAIKFGNYIKTATKATSKFVAKHIGDICIGGGVIALVSAVVCCAKDTPKAEKRVKEAEEKKGEPLTKVEKVKAAAPAYIPTISATFTGVALVATGHFVINKRLSAALFSLAASERAYADFTEKTKEVVGERKANDIMEAVAEKRASELPKEVYESDDIPGLGDTLILDTYSNILFRSNMQKITEAVGTFNDGLYSEMSKSYGELLELYGVERSEISDAVGWNINNGHISIRPGASLLPNGKPVITISYWIEPSSDYRNY